MHYNTLERGSHAVHTWYKDYTVSQSGYHGCRQAEETVVMYCLFANCIKQLDRLSLKEVTPACIKEHATILQIY